MKDSINWKDTEEGKAVLEKARQSCEAASARQSQLIIDEHKAWLKESTKTMVKEGLLRRADHIEEPFYQELPLSVGFNKDLLDGNRLEWVALGGHDITCYLPPEVKREIEQHLNNLN